MSLTLLPPKKFARLHVVIYKCKKLKSEELGVLLWYNIRRKFSENRSSSSKVDGDTDSMAITCTYFVFNLSGEVG
jgi:hypothetical protein